MTAPLDSTTTPDEIAAFDPTLEQVAAVNVALPPAGTRTTVPQPAGDSARVNLGAGTEFAQVCVFRQGDSVVVTANGYGSLVIQNSPPNSPNPPEVADSHGQVVRAESIGAGCGTQAAGLADIAPAAGGANPAALAAIAPAAGPAGAPGAPGGEPSGGHFNSNFNPTEFLNLNYGPVDPLAFGRTPPILEPGPGATNEGEPFTPPPPPPPPTVLIDSLDMRSNSAEADIPTAAAPPTWTAVGDPISAADLIANEGKSVYDTGNGALVGEPSTTSLQLQTGADVTIRLVNEDAGFANITGYYTYDSGGNITGVKVLWLNSAPDGTLTTEADLYGLHGSVVQTFHVADATNLGFFMVSDGGGDGALTGFGPQNKALFDQLFAALGVTPGSGAYTTSDALIGVINDHLRFDAASGTIQVDVDGNPNNGAAGWTTLAGFEYYSNHQQLNSDQGQSNLVDPATAHTVSGVENGALVVGFEDLPFIGTVNDPNAPTTLTPGAGYPAGVAPTDFDYNDTLLDIRVEYTPVEIAPGVWSPLTAIDNSLNNNLGSITQVQFTVAGLGDGVSLNNFAALLSAGWQLNVSGLDGNGNGTYTLLPPGGTASTAAFVAELSKLQIDVAATTPGAHGDVTINFTATDSAGLTDSSTSVMNFADAGTAPPAPPAVDVTAGPLPPPSPHVEQLITT